MLSHSRIGASLAASLALVLVAGAAGALILPPGFVAIDAFPDVEFLSPVNLAYTPDGGAYVAELPGRVQRVRPDGTKPGSPWLDIQDDVLFKIDLGLIGMAVDPEWSTNGWVYIAYTVDPDGDGVEDEDDAFVRVSRYRSTTDPDVADLSTREDLIGATWPFGIPSMSPSHSAGSIVFGEDGSLLFGMGDGASYNYADSGGTDAGFGPGMSDPSEDIGAFRARTVNSMCGKILRFDKDTGLGLDSNPFWDGDPSSDRSRVWLYGLRNPWRFYVRPGTGDSDPENGDPGTLFIANVGYDDYEELEIAATSGFNFGWPCKEAVGLPPEYPDVSETAAGNSNVLCGAGLNADNPVADTDPTIWYHHSNSSLSNPVGWQGATVCAGPFYTGWRYPAPFSNRMFLGDFLYGWVRTLEFDAADSLVAWSSFITGFADMVDLELEPTTGDLVAVDIFEDRILRFVYEPNSTGVDVALQGAPVVVSAHPNPFRAETTISFDLPRATAVSLDVYDVRGSKVRSLFQGAKPPGEHAIAWDGRDASGRPVPPGVYFHRVETEWGSFAGRSQRLR